MTLATDYLGLDALLSAEEITWRDTVAGVRARPHQAQHQGLVREGGISRARSSPRWDDSTCSGTHLSGYGCPGRSAVEYGLAALELEAGDSGCAPPSAYKGRWL